MIAWFKKLVSGWIFFGGGKPFGEWAGKLIWVLGIIIVVNFLSSIFIKQPNNNRTTTIVFPFAKVEKIEQKSEQRNEERRKWWQPIPYVSLSGETTYYSDGMESGLKAEAGIRWDF